MKPVKLTITHKGEQRSIILKKVMRAKQEILEFAATFNMKPGDEYIISASKGDKILFERREIAIDPNLEKNKDIEIKNYEYHKEE
jgi:hypothetical protein